MSPPRRALAVLALLGGAFAAGRATVHAPPATPVDCPAPLASPVIQGPRPSTTPPPPSAEAPTPAAPEPEAWESVPTAEQPERWRAALTEALRDCPTSTSLVSTNCNDYPCVAVLRVGGLVSSSETVRAELEDCPNFAALRAQTPDLLAIDAEQRCPDGSTAPVIILTAVQEETATRLSGGDGRPLQGLFLTGVAFGRRVEGALATLPCPSDP